MRTSSLKPRLVPSTLMILLPRIALTSLYMISRLESSGKFMFEWSSQKQDIRRQETTSVLLIGVNLCSLPLRVGSEASFNFSTLSKFGLSMKLSRRPVSTKLMHFSTGLTNVLRDSFEASLSLHQPLASIRAGNLSESV